MFTGIDPGFGLDRGALAMFEAAPVGWTFYDEAQNWRPCPGSMLPAYHTGAIDVPTGRGILECAECGKLWTFDRLVGGRTPFHKASRRNARRVRRKHRAMRKNRKGW